MCWSKSSATLPMQCQISMFILCNQSCLTHWTSDSSWPHFLIAFFRVSFILDSLPAPRITPHPPLPPALLFFLLECLSVFLSYSLYPNSLNNLIETQNFHSKLMTLFPLPSPHTLLNSMCLPSSPNNTHSSISNRSQTQYGQDSPHSSSCLLQAAPPITFLVSILHDNFCLFKLKNSEPSLYFIRRKCILGAPGLKQAKIQPFLIILTASVLHQANILSDLYYSNSLLTGLLTHIIVSYHQFLVN